MKKAKLPSMSSSMSESAAPAPVGPSLSKPPRLPQEAPVDMGPGVTIHISHHQPHGPVDNDVMAPGEQDPDMEVDKMPVKSLKDLAKIKNAIHMGKAKRSKGGI